MASQNSLPFMISSGIISFFLCGILLAYIWKWRKNSIPIMKVLAILIFNEILQSACEMVSYIDGITGIACAISLIGRLAFIVSCNFWIIFITRLIYKEKSAPGKYVDLVDFIFRNLILAYLPALIVCAFLALLMIFSKFDLDEGCRKTIKIEHVEDYIIYVVCFILPNFIALIINSAFLILYWKKPGIKWTMFLSFPLISSVFSIFYLFVRIYQLVGGQRQPLLEIALIIEPLLYGILFLFIYHRQKPKVNAKISDITLEDPLSIEKSFIEFNISD